MCSEDSQLTWFLFTSGIMFFTVASTLGKYKSYRCYFICLGVFYLLQYFLFAFFQEPSYDVYRALSLSISFICCFFVFLGKKLDG
jgi:predicted MFS family arabinose efflux permease